MAGIYWLASYPKSGNTWLRVFLANAVGKAEQPYDINALREFGGSDSRASYYERAAARPIEALSDPELHRLRPAVHRFLANRRPGHAFVKTHNAIAVIDGIPTITPELTAGAVYVVRNPLDVAVSFAHHFAIGLDAAVEQLCLPGSRVGTADRAVFSQLGTWSRHVESWTEAPGLSPHVVRYEDLLARPVPSFRAVADYLRLELGREALKRAVRFSSFKELAMQEARAGFVERGAASARFFREGSAGQWRRHLGAPQVDRIAAVNGEVMRRYGYLP
jgi:hypothetical protein